MGVGTAPPAADIAEREPGTFALTGEWTAFGIGAIQGKLDRVSEKIDRPAPVVDGSKVLALDTAGVWLVQRLLRVLRHGEGEPQLQGWSPQFLKLLELGGQGRAIAPERPDSRARWLENVGRAVIGAWRQFHAGLVFVGEVTVALAQTVASPGRLRVRPILHNIQSAGASALPIVGLLAFMLGIVVAYQGADQLQRYGANIFVADLIGLSMVREFAPLMTAIIVAGRSGSAYAAQIGAMQTTEEIDAMRTLGISPLELLTLPKLVALMIALPLLTVYADAAGIFGGMLMARAKLGVGFGEFIDRLGNAVSVSSYMVGLAKAPVFAAIIAVIGCFQGFRTEGGADSVGRQTTRSVVQAIFMVIVVDALFSILFSILDL